MALQIVFPTLGTPLLVLTKYRFFPVLDASEGFKLPLLELLKPGLLLTLTFKKRLPGLFLMLVEQFVFPLHPVCGGCTGG